MSSFQHDGFRNWRFIEIEVILSNRGFLLLSMMLCSHNRSEFALLSLRDGPDCKTGPSLSSKHSLARE